MPPHSCGQWLGFTFFMWTIGEGMQEAQTMPVLPLRARGAEGERGMGGGQTQTHPNTALLPQPQEGFSVWWQVCVCIQSAYGSVSEFRYNSGMGVALNDLCSATCQSVFKSNEQREPSTKMLHDTDSGF